MQALEACDNKMLKIGEVLGLTWDAMDISEEAIAVPNGVDAELLIKVLGNPEMAALLTSLAKTMKV